MRQREFYHYTRFISKIKKEGILLAASFSKTTTYDMILEFCPEVLIDKNEIAKLDGYKRRHKRTILKFQKEQDEDKTYESAYRNLKLKYKSRLLQEFFDRNWYIVAFSELFEKGWINKKERYPSIFKKIGDKYVKFKIIDAIARQSFVLDQKWWSKRYHGSIIEKKYGKNWWDKYLEYNNIWREKGVRYLSKKQKEFMAFFARILFGRYYNSIVRLDNYKKGSFKTPEFWIGGDIPISKCEFGEVSSKEFYKKTGISEKEITERGIKEYDISKRKQKSKVKNIK